VVALGDQNLGQKSRPWRKMEEELQRADQTDAGAGTEPVTRNED